MGQFCRTATTQVAGVAEEQKTSISMQATCLFSWAATAILKVKPGRHTRV